MTLRRRYRLTRTALAAVSVAFVGVSWPAGNAEPAVHVPVSLTRLQQSPEASWDHLYRPVVVADGAITVDCGHPGVWCDDEGA